MHRNINNRSHRIIILVICLPNNKRLEQTRLEKGFGNMELPIEAKVIPILSACFLSLTFQEQQRELYISSLVSFNKLLNLVISIQTRKIPVQTYQELARSIAASFNQGYTTARNIINWKKS